MRIVFPLIVAAALPLAACQGEAPSAEGSEAGNAALSAQSYQERLRAMSEGQRNGVFLRAIRDAGQPCQHVERATEAPLGEGMRSWLAVCDDGGHWTVAISANGVAQVTKVEAAGSPAS